MFQALLASHDSIAQVDYGPVLPPLPDDTPEDEEAMRIVCLVKNNQPLVSSPLSCVTVVTAPRVLEEVSASLRQQVEHRSTKATVM